MFSQGKIIWGKNVINLQRICTYPRDFTLYLTNLLVGAVIIPILPIRKLKLENLEELCLHSRACSVG